MTTSAPGLLRGLEGRIRAALSELAKFGTVGALAFVIDVGVFNLVLHMRPDKPLTAKIISTVIAATVAYVLNRAWSFRHRQRSSVRREYVMFFLLNAIGLAISLGCLGFSHYVLGLDSRLADNISGNVIGIGLGTLFRFWSYRRFVWAAPEAVEVAALDGDPAAAAVLGDLEDGTITRPVPSV